MHDNEIEQLRTNLNYTGDLSSGYFSTTIKQWTADCPVHGEIPNYMLTTGNSSVTICWKCIGDFYAENMPKVKPL